MQKAKRAARIEITSYLCLCSGLKLDELWYGVSSVTFHATLSLGLFMIALFLHPTSIPKEILIFSEHFV